MRQAALMNYNNFASRISAPRAARVSRPPVPAPETARKPRKPVRRRLSTAAALFLLALPLFIPAGGAHAAGVPGSFPDATPAFISVNGLSEPGSFGMAGLSPITEALLGIGLAVAVIQARLLFGNRQLEC
jgi:hypothetical protein